jgi:hypothetical protein
MALQNTKWISVSICMNTRNLAFRRGTFTKMLPTAIRSHCRRLKEFQVDQTADTQWAALKNLNFDDPQERDFDDEEE